MAVEKARREDIPVICDFQVAMALETENIQLATGTVRRGVEAVFDHPERGTYWVYRDQNRTVASLLITPEWSDWRNKNFLWIQSVYVHPQFRGQGIFRKLYNHIKEMVMADPDIAGLRLYVDQENTPALSTYKKVGMTQSHYLFFEWTKQ
ncbi:MAG: GNAT family N-acetyltransferase [Bacteroidales bacterium]